MNTHQVILIKKTWRMFRAIDPVLVGDAFYSKLFAKTPSLRKMFPADMESQYKKLVDMLSTIVIRLDQSADLNDYINGMANRHFNYGVRPAHYKLAGEALLWTLQQGLGKDWTAEVKEAWTNCYHSLAAAMMNAVQSPRA